MTLASQWVEDVRYHLDGARSDEANILNADYTPGDGVVSLRYPTTNLAAGSILTIGTNTLRVLSVNSLAKQADVIGGYNGSTDAAAVAGVMVRVNPRFTDHRIFRELNNHLLALSSPRVGLFQVSTIDLTYAGWVQGYGISGNIIRVLEVRRELVGPSLAWPRIPSGDWDLVRSAPTADFPTGLSLRVRGGDTGFAIQAVVAAPFTQLAALSDDVSTTGLPGTATDIPPLGAAINLMAGREVSRNSPGSQGDTRRTDEVGPGAVAASYRGLQQQWVIRTGQEEARLLAQWGYTK